VKVNQQFTLILLPCLALNLALYSILLFELITGKFLLPSGSMGPDMFLKLYLVKSYKNTNHLAATEAREKIALIWNLCNYRLLCKCMFSLF